MQFISWIQAFKAGEVRDVNDDVATMLLANPNFSLYDSGKNLDIADETTTFVASSTSKKKKK